MRKNKFFANSKIEKERMNFIRGRVNTDLNKENYHSNLLRHTQRFKENINVLSKRRDEKAKNRDFEESHDER